MKFAYEYRTSDNVRHTGVVVASDREAAFRKLREQGVRPGRMVEAPGLMNKLIGKGKRWSAIVILAAVLVAVLASFLREENAVRDAYECRAQIFGDPAVMQKLAKEGWRQTFPDAGEAWMARHAIPGCQCDCNQEELCRDKVVEALMARKDKSLTIDEADSDELKKMKRIINGMKRELSDYVERPSDVSDYIVKACERCRIEKGIYDSVVGDIAVLERRLETKGADRKKILEHWDKKNALLRSLGLSTIPLPE